MSWPEDIAPGGRIWFDSFYCLWDSFRSQIPFLTVLDTYSVVDMLKGLLNIYEAQGWLPDCHMSLCKGYTQGGSNADIVLADGYQKIRDADVDWNLAYEAVVKDAEEEPYDWCCEGGGGLDSWRRLGYIPVQDFDYKGFGTMTRSISRALEYSYNDFAISRMAGLGLGSDINVEKYQDSSGNWRNLFKADQTSSLFNGSDTGRLHWILSTQVSQSDLGVSGPAALLQPRQRSKLRLLSAEQRIRDLREQYLGILFLRAPRPSGSHRHVRRP